MNKFPELFRFKLGREEAVCFRRIAARLGLSESSFARTIILNHLAVAENATEGHWVPLGATESPTPPIRKVSLSLAQNPKNRDSSPIPPRFAFEGKWLRITERQDGDFRDAYPYADCQAEYRKMEAWMEVNPTRRPKKLGRFANNWLAKVPKPNPTGETYAERDRRLREERDRSLFPEADISKLHAYLDEGVRKRS